MTIQELYLKLAKRGLHISLFFCSLAIIGVLLALNIPFPIAIFPFMLLSVCYFFIHLYYWHRAKKMVPLDLATVFPANHYLIENHAPNYYFFLPNGLLYQAITLQKLNSGQQVTFMSKESNKRTYTLIRKKRSEQMITHNGHVMLRFLHAKDHILHDGSMNRNTILVRFNGMNGLSFYKNERIIARLQKGWMPLDWLHLFRLNTPVLTFYEPVNDLEKETIFLASTIYL